MKSRFIASLPAGATCVAISDPDGRRMTTLLEVQNLVKQFPIVGSRKVVQAVNGVDFTIGSGETLRWSANPVLARRRSVELSSV